MKIAELLQSDEYNVRVSCADRWLVWHNDQWVIYERGIYEKKTKIIFETNSEDLAVEKFIED
jgi:hypothetical protein